MEIILCSSDSVLVKSWSRIIKDDFKVLNKLEDINDSLIILDYIDSTHNIESIAKKNRVLVLHRNPDIKIAKELLSCGVRGYGNALMRDHFLLSAIETIRDGMVWLYPAFTSELIEKISSVNKQASIDEIISILSKREKEVALLLKDGLTYKDIAQKLEITPRTVKAHAQSSYIKLNVKDRLSLALLLK